MMDHISGTYAGTQVDARTAINCKRLVVAAGQSGTSTRFVSKLGSEITTCGLKFRAALICFAVNQRERYVR